MRRIKVVLLLLTVALAVSSLVYAMLPLIRGARKAQEIHQETEAFYDSVRERQEQDGNKASGSDGEALPYQSLRTVMEQHNQWLYELRQSSLTDRESYEEPPFSLMSFGLPDEVFGVISIPKMDVEMPLYLGANEVNMANGAAVLAQTSIPIGGDNTNAVIAGHRGWNGYDYFRYIDKLETCDKIQITNLWETLTYTVSEIKIVSPDDVDSILIQPGRDMVTLLTCHPYASGGQYRYLVFCDRQTTDTGGEQNVLLP